MTAERIGAQNLIKQVAPEKVVRPPGFYASLVLDVVTVLSAAMFGFFYRGYLMKGTGLFSAIAAFVPFAITSIFGMLLTKSLSRRLIVLAFATLGIVAFFYTLPYSFLIGVTLAFFGFLIWGEVLSRAELQNSLNIRFFRVIRPQLNKLLTASALLAVLLYLPQLNAAEDIISPETFNRIYAFSARTAAFLYPELKFDSSAEVFARSFAEFQLKTNLTFLQLLPPARERVLQEATKQVLAGLSEWADFEISPPAPLSSPFYKIISDSLKSWQEKLGDKFRLLWGVGVFFLLRGLGGLLHFIIGGISFFIYQSLLAADFIKIVGESRVHETLEYS
jgi:hypothetical protein